MKDLQQRFKGDLHHKFESYFGKETVMKGTLKFNGSLRYDGKFEGEISSKGVLHVGESGVLRADISTGALLNSGDIGGNISSGKKISILANGILDGNITTPILQVEPGAVFNGKCNMPKQRDNAHVQKGVVEPVLELPAEDQEIFTEKPFPKASNATKPVVPSKGLLVAGTISLFIIVSVSLMFLTGDNFLNLPKSVLGVIGLDLTERPETVEELLQEGERLTVEGKIDEAVKLFKQVLENSDAKPSDHFVVARNFFDLGLEKEAMEEYRYIIEKEPENKGFRKGYVRLLIKNEMDDLAVDQLKKLTKLDPVDIKSHLELALLYQEKEQKDDLFNEYAIIAKLTPNNEKISTEYALMLEKRGKYKEAISIYSKLLTLNKNNSYANLRLNRLYFFTGHEEKASKGFEKLELMDPDGIEALNNEGFHQVDLRNTDKALEIFSRAVAKDKENLRARFGLVAAFTRKGYLTAAIRECEKLLAIQNGFVPAQNRLAWLYGRKGMNLDKAILLSLKTLESNPLSPDYLDTLSELYFKKGNVEKSIEYIKKALEQSPDSLYYKKQLRKFTSNSSGTT